MASAGPCASLHLTPDRQPHQHATTLFFYRPDALPAAQPTASKHWRLYQSTENSKKKTNNKNHVCWQEWTGPEVHGETHWQLVSDTVSGHFAYHNKNTCVFKQICFWFLHHRWSNLQAQLLFGDFEQTVLVQSTKHNKKGTISTFDTWTKLSNYGI